MHELSAMPTRQARRRTDHVHDLAPPHKREGVVAVEAQVLIDHLGGAEQLHRRQGMRDGQCCMRWEADGIQAGDASTGNA